MIVLRRKQFAFGIGNLSKAISGVAKKGNEVTKLTNAERVTAGLKGAGGLGLTALTVGGATIGTAKAIGGTKDAITGKMGEADGAGY
jgi:hypothetical protein